MRSLYTLKHAIKSRLGELWWYSLILFLTQRLGDVINAIIGIWLVPHYIPQNELGAVLPLMSIGSLLGLPLTILMMPFMKFLTMYMAQNEYGKVKALLRDMLLLSSVIFLLLALTAHFLFPLVFTRMRVDAGSLGLLIIIAGSLSATQPIFTTALQALKRFHTLSITGFFSALIRLVTLLIALPIRGLSGFFVGQITPVIFTILASLVNLRSYLGKKTTYTSYWNDDWRRILQYTLWIAFLYSLGTLTITAENFVIRHRLMDLESAGFYMISRFAEISLLLGVSITTVLFPIAAENHEKGEAQHHLLQQSLKVTFLGSIAIAALVIPLTVLLFSLRADWNTYLTFIPHMVVLCIAYSLRGTTHCFVTFEIAQNRFKFVPFFASMYTLEAIGLYSLTGYTFFEPWLPKAVFAAIQQFNPCRLSVILSVMLGINSILLLLTGYLIASARKDDANPSDI